MSIQKYYHLFAGEVMFHTKETEEQGAMKVNTLVTTTGTLVTAKDIATAQQGMQKTFFDRIPDKDVLVYDVFIISVNSLGKMTQEQFVKGMDAFDAGNPLREKIVGEGSMAMANPFEVN